MNKITPFNYGDNLIRVVDDEITGEPLWVAKDVCNVLDLKDVNRTLSKLDEDEKGTQTLSTLGGMQKMSVINEAGLYNLIFRSNKPEAKPFKRWVTHEVLPTIRKTGSYGDNSDVAQIIPVLTKIMEGMNGMVQMMGTILENQNKTQNDSLSREQIDQLKLAVNRAVKAAVDCHRMPWGDVSQKVYKELNGRMGVFTYTHIHPADFQEAMDLLECMKVAKEIEMNSGEIVRLYDLMDTIKGGGR
jgi:prophage antirepressor-like protein